MVEFQAVGTALAALAAVLLAILLIARGLRHFGLAGALPARGARRLALVEALPLDRNRRLLLLRCDGREMLVLVGGGQDVLLPPPEPRA